LIKRRKGGGASSEAPFPPPSPICLFSFYIKSEKIDGGGRSSKEKRGEKRGLCKGLDNIDEIISKYRIKYIFCGLLQHKKLVGCFKGSWPTSSFARAPPQQLLSCPFLFFCFAAKQHLFLHKFSEHLNVLFLSLSLLFVLAIKTVGQICLLSPQRTSPIFEYWVRLR
jgi:hypothetical protein